MNTKSLYLLITIIGAIVPYIFFINFFMEEGFNLITFSKALFENSAAAGFSIDLLLTSFTFWFFMYKDKGVKSIWPVIILNLTIGLSCAFPFYLYLKEKESNS